MTVKDVCEKTNGMATVKRQKTESSESSTQEPKSSGSFGDDIPSSIMMKGIIMGATRSPDMNIVEPINDDISDIEITPGDEPLSESDLPPRPKKNKKKKKKHTNGEQTQTPQTDLTNVDPNSKCSLNAEYNSDIL